MIKYLLDINIKEFIINESIWFVIVTILMSVAVAIDLSTGISKVKALGEKIVSGGLRRTITKLKEYLYLVYFGSVVDVALFVMWKQIPIGIIMACLASCTIEFISVIENLKAKKSAAGKVPEMLEKIVKCDSKEKAVELINEITNG